MPPLLRWSLLASGPLNLLGASLFAPPGVALRAIVGVPGAPPLYAWTVSLWVLAFGLAYAHAGWSGRADRSLLVLGGFGKIVFVVLMALAAGDGAVPVSSALASTPDLMLAGIFLWGASRTPADIPPGVHQP